MDQLGLVGIGQFAARLAGGDRERGQHHQLAGEGLGRGDADLRTGQRRQHGLAFARDRRGRHVDDGERVHALRFRVAQRGQRVGGLAGLRNEDRQIALAQRRLAVAEFGGDIEFDRHAAPAVRTSIWRCSRHSSRCRRPTIEMRWISLKSNGSLAGSATRSVAMST